MLTQGRSLSGNERNCCYLNLRDQSFANISSASGFDFPSDSRGLAVVDWDHDGDIDVWMSHRTSPRVRFLRNQAADTKPESSGSPNSNWIALRLKGTNSNRDAIGARVSVVARSGDSVTRPQSKTLRAGEGYLSQSSKWLHFGLGEQDSIQKIEVNWPNGRSQVFADLAVNRHYVLTQDHDQPETWNRPDSHKVAELKLRPNQSEPMVRPIRIVPHRRFPIPKLEYFDRHGKSDRIESNNKKLTLVIVWATWCSACSQEIAELKSAQQQLEDASLQIAQLCVDDLPAAATQLPTVATTIANQLSKRGISWKGGLANADTRTKLDILQRMFVSKESQFSVPLSLLLDARGNLAVVYKGSVSITMLLDDCHRFRYLANDTRDSAVPMRGRWFVNQVPADRMAMVEKLIASSLNQDAFEFLQTELFPIANDESSIWPADNISNAFFRVGVNLGKENRWQPAEQSLKRAIELSPGSMRVRAAMANLMQAMGRDADAVKQYEEMRKLQPQNPVILNDLAWILASSSDADVRKPKVAVNLARQACEITQYRLAAVIDTLATALASSGDFDQAVRTMRQAIEVAKSTNNQKAVEKFRKKLVEYRSQI